MYEKQGTAVRPLHVGESYRFLPPFFFPPFFAIQNLPPLYE